MNDAALAPWADRNGRFSWLRAAVFAAVAAPALWILFAWAFDRLGPEPYKAATHQSGVWALRFLLAALAITPLRRRLGWSRLIGVRRMVGVAAFCYIAGHLGLFILHENGDLAKVAGEIVSRVYLAIGFVALIGLAALAGTSFDAAIRRMGPRWRQLHRLAYPLTALGVLHYFMQSKIDVSDPAFLFGLFAGLMAHRVFARAPAAVATTLLIAAFSGVAAALSEYLWHLTMTGLPAGRVLMANLDFSYEIRSPWIAAAIMAAPVAALAARRLTPG